jgi:hypothetical protein
MKVARICIAVAAIATASSLIATVPAGAHTHSKPEPTPTVLTTEVAAPFNLDVRGGRVLVADGGLNKILRVTQHGSVSTVVADAPATTGVARARGYLAYTTTAGGPPAGITASGLHITRANGYHVFADTLAYEKAHNPDAGVHYGVTNPSQCVSYALSGAGFPVDYKGIVDSHAYSVAAFGKGWVVADAGANALLYVTNSGRISTLAVLPAQPATITPEIAAGLGVPGLAECGTFRYDFEAVPTDVEVGKDGFLYVTVLPGGPESAALGARGKVYRVNPWNGKVTLVASGLLGATNLAIWRGDIYVTELFAGRVSRVRHGGVTKFLDLPGALSIESGPRGLYVGTGVTGPSSVVRIDLSKGWRH